MSEEEALAAVSAAEREFSRIKSTIEAEVKAARAQGEAAHAQELLAASNALTLARAGLREAKDACDDHPWTGKRVFKLKPQGRYSWEKVPPKRVEGIVETVRSDTTFPANMAPYARPAVGSGIVRLLKKDGAPGLAFDGMRGNHHGWQLAPDASQ